MSIPIVAHAELKKEMARGGEELIRSTLAKASKVVSRCGVELVNVRIKRIDYVESVRERVYARLSSKHKRIAVQIRSEGECQSAEIIGTMETKLRQIRPTTYRRLQKMRGKPDVEATEVDGAVYGADPELYAFSLSLEAYKAAQSAIWTVILTADRNYYRHLKPADREPRLARSVTSMTRPSISFCQWLRLKPAAPQGP
jgi:membrane protease subunit HflC